MRLVSILLGGLLMLLSASVVRADVPPAHQGLLLLRTLAYDRTLKARAGAAVTILILYKEGDETSQVAQLDMTQVLREAALHLDVDGLPVRVIALPFRGAPGLDAALAGQHISALYLCYGLADDLAAISAATRRHAVLSMAGIEQYVGDGVAVGFVDHEGRSVLLVDVEAVHAEGAQLEASLLRFAQLIKRRSSP